MSNFEAKSSLVDGVLSLEFSHNKANCLSLELVTKLRMELESFVDNKDVKVLFIKPTEGKIYSAGANLEDYIRLATEPLIANYLSQIGLLLAEILYFPCTTVTKIEGKAVGGGVGLLSTFDYVVSSSESSVRLSELSLGIAPLVISPFLVLKMGVAKFSELSFSGQWKDSSWAYQNGLISEIVEGKDIDTVIDERIQHFASSGLTPAKELKESIYPKKSELIKIIKDNSKLNAPFVFNAIRDKKI